MSRIWSGRHLDHGAKAISDRVIVESRHVEGKVICGTCMAWCLDVGRRQSLFE